MTKATQAATVLAVAAIVYAVFYLGIISTPAKFRTEILPVIPFWALVSFGAYALGSLGYDVLTFNDKPEKYSQLLKEIDEAKADLRDQGVDVD